MEPLGVPPEVREDLVAPFEDAPGGVVVRFQREPGQPVQAGGFEERDKRRVAVRQQAEGAHGIGAHGGGERQVAGVEAGGDPVLGPGADGNGRVVQAPDLKPPLSQPQFPCLETHTLGAQEA